MIGGFRRDAFGRQQLGEVANRMVGCAKIGHVKLRKDFMRGDRRRLELN